jgi:hypothetical protein
MGIFLLSKDGIQKGLSVDSESINQGLKLLGATDKEFPCCCLQCPCVGDPDESEDTVYDTTGGLFSNVEVSTDTTDFSSGFGSIPFGRRFSAQYQSPPVKTGKYETAEEIGDAFRESIFGSFDGIAIKAGYAICIYTQQYFEGRPFAVVKGPKIVNNIQWIPISQGGSDNATWDEFGLSSIYNGEFPIYFSLSQMRGSTWQNPKSMIICKAERLVTQFGFGRLNGTGPAYTEASPLID